MTCDKAEKKKVLANLIAMDKTHASEKFIPSLAKRLYPKVDWLDLKCTYHPPISDEYFPERRPFTPYHNIGRVSWEDCQQEIWKCKNPPPDTLHCSFFGTRTQSHTMSKARRYTWNVYELRVYLHWFVTERRGWMVVCSTDQLPDDDLPHIFVMLTNDFTIEAMLGQNIEVKNMRVKEHTDADTPLCGLHSTDLRCPITTGSGMVTMLSGEGEERRVMKVDLSRCGIFVRWLMRQKVCELAAQSAASGVAEGMGKCAPKHIGKRFYRGIPHPDLWLGKPSAPWACGDDGLPTHVYGVGEAWISLIMDALYDTFRISQCPTFECLEKLEQLLNTPEGPKSSTGKLYWQVLSKTKMLDFMWKCKFTVFPLESSIVHDIPEKMSGIANSGGASNSTYRCAAPTRPWPRRCSLPTPSSCETHSEAPLTLLTQVSDDRSSEQRLGGVLCQPLLQAKHANCEWREFDDRVLPLGQRRHDM